MTVKKKTGKKISVIKVARSVSFSSDRLSNQKVISKERERYIKSVSSNALSAIG